MTTYQCPVCGEHFPREEVVRPKPSKKFTAQRPQSITITLGASPSPPPSSKAKSGGGGGRRRPHDGPIKDETSVLFNATAHVRTAEEASTLKANKVTEYHLSSGIDFYATMPGDSGWGCGYRNIQIMWSFLRRYNPYRLALQASPYGAGSVPPISTLQIVLECAWADGFDPEGAAKFNGSPVGSRKWIGTAECAVVLRSLGVKAKIVDFLPPDAGRKLIAWVWNYFTRAWGEACVPPLYFQHSGHSRTIIGIEKRVDGELYLLVLDPSIRRTEAEEQLDIYHNLKPFRVSVKGLPKKYYQIVYPDGVATDQEGISRLKILAPDERV